MRFQPVLRLSGVFQNDAAFTAGGNRFHFRVLLHTDDDDESASAAGLFHDPVNVHHLRAGGVLHERLSILQCLKRLGRYTVRPDQDSFPFLHFLYLIHRAHAALSETLHYIGVVDQHSEACARPFLQQGLCHLHRPADAEAESRAFRYSEFFHWISGLSVSGWIQKRSKISWLSAAKLSS